MPPLATITGGSLFAYFKDWADFTLDTNRFAAQFSLADTGSIPIPAQPLMGSSMDCSAILAGGMTLNFGMVDIAGSNLKLWFEGTLTITAESLIVPNLPVVGPVHVARPFSLSGNLIAYPSNPIVNPPPQTFEFKLAGKGTVTARFTEPFGPKRKVTSYFYQFL